jgi:hypothetical protein
MEDEIVQVAANEVEVATSTEPTEVIQEAQEPIQSASIETTTDVSATKAFSERLKKSIDAEYSSLYGAEYGIHSKKEYDTYMANQQKIAEREALQEETGIDADTLQSTFEKLKANDPDFQELKSIRTEKHIATSLADLNNELKDCGIDLHLKDLSEAEVAKIPNVEKVTEMVQNGKTFAEAVFLANKKDFFAKKTDSTQKETLAKIAANNAASPGSLGASADNTASFTMQQINAMSQDDINKNYGAVMASIKRMKGG